MSPEIQVETRDRRALPHSLGARVLAGCGVGGLLLGAGIVVVAALTAPHSDATTLGGQAAISRALVAAELAHSRTPAALRRLERGVSADGTTVRVISGAARPEATGDATTTSLVSSVGSSAHRRLQLVVSRSVPTSSANRMLPAIIAAGLGLLALLLLAGRWFVRRHLEVPLRRLRVAIERLAAGEYGESIDVGGPPELRAAGEALAELATRVAELQGQATTDPLTGAANRRFFLKALEVEIQRAARHRTPLALAQEDHVR
jgi:hypothetical protein